MWRCNWSGMFGTGGWSNWPMGGGPISLLFTILLIAGLIYVISLIVGNYRSKPGSRMDRDDSLVILRERFARGEISSEEYERMKDMLTQ